MSSTFHLKRFGISARLRLRAGGACPVSVSGAICLYVIILPADDTPISSRRACVTTTHGGHMTRTRSGLGQKLEDLSSTATRWTGSTPALALAVGMLLV